MKAHTNWFRTIMKTSATFSSRPLVRDYKFIRFVRLVGNRSEIVMNVSGRSCPREPHRAQIKMSYSPQEEMTIEGNYSDLFAALRAGRFGEAEDILRETRAKEFFNVSEDMARIIADSKLNSK